MKPEPRKYMNTYRIDTFRLPHWDYGSAAAYFITINLSHRIPFFGDIIDGNMHLSEIGKIAQTEWLKTPVIREDMNLKLGEFVVMPDHFHAILMIGKNPYNQFPKTEQPEHLTRQHQNQYETGKFKNQFGPQSKNLASVIRGFKSAVTKQARLLEPSFAWQSLYHEHVIRSRTAFVRISKYIHNNPINWKQK